MLAMTKKDVIRLLEQIALYLEIKGENQFRVSAYRRAAQALERDVRSLAEIDDFSKIKGIGKGTNAVIVEYIEQGTSTLLEELKEEVPVGLTQLLRIPGLGGKRIAKLYQELGVHDLASLKAACESGQVSTVPGFGQKTAENILQAILELDERPARLPIASVIPIAEQIEAYLEEIPAVQRFSRAGSLRRVREMIKDIDFIIATEAPAEVREALLTMDGVKDVVASGDSKVSVTIEAVYDINVDYRLVAPEEFATTLHHFTGSKEHNIAMRQIAKSRGEKINEYGVEQEETGDILTFNSEVEFFNHFNLPYIPPELREDTTDLNQLLNQELDFIQLSDIRGDLHVHSTWSDGAQSIEEMVNHARECGYDYIAITDHSKFLQVANGLDEDRVRRQQEEIARLNEKYTDIHIFSGIEMDILPNATLDFSDDLLSELDFVIASIHSGFTQSKEQIMERLRVALENPYVNLIAHPTGRLIGSREGYAVDLEELIQLAKDTQTALEINANPHRLDLAAKWVKLAHEAGVHIAINTDAHHVHGFRFMTYGVSVANQALTPKEHVLNTWSLDKLQDYLRRK